MVLFESRPFESKGAVVTVGVGGGVGEFRRCSWLEAPTRDRSMEDDGPATGWREREGCDFFFCLMFGCQTYMKGHEWENYLLVGLFWMSL